MRINNKNNYYLLFIISPIVGLINSIRFYKTGSYKNIIWLFVVFYSYTITLPTKDADIDISRRIESFNNEAAHTDYRFSEFVRSYKDEDNWNADFFEPILVYIVSRFFSDVKIMFIVYGLLFGFFYSRNIAFILDKIDSLLAKKITLLLFILALINPFWNINGFRFWFATHVYLYVLLTYFFENKKKYLLWLLIVPLIHFSYIFAVAIFVFYYILGNRTRLFFIFFIISVIIGRIKFNFLETLFSYLPGVIEKKANGYTNDEYIEKVVELNGAGMNWYATFNIAYLNYFTVVAIILCYWKSKDLIKKEYNSIFSYVLFFLGFAFLVSSIPSMNRFITPGLYLFFSFYILFVANHLNINWLKKFRYWTSFGLLICLTVQIRLGFDTISFLSVFTNPLIAPFFTEENFSLINIFK